MVLGLCVSILPFSFSNLARNILFCSCEPHCHTRSSNHANFGFSLDPISARSSLHSSNAHRAAPTLARVPYLPYFGELSDRWVGEE